MATEKFTGSQTDSALSDADLRHKELRFCKRTATGVNIAGAGERVAGVISEGKNIGLYTSFKTGNILKVIASAAIAAGAQVASAADGAVRTAVAGDNVCGSANVAASGAGVVIDITFDQMGIKA